MIRTFLLVAGLVLTLEAALFLAKGNLGLSAETIAQLSSTRWDYSTDVVRNLATQRADTWVGVVLLLAAFGLQLGNALWPSRWVDMQIHSGAVIYAIAFCAIVGIGAFYAAREVAAVTAARVEAVLKQAAEHPSRSPTDAA